MLLCTGATVKQTLKSLPAFHILGSVPWPLDKALGALSAQNYTELLSLFASPCAHSQVLTALQWWDAPALPEHMPLVGELVLQLEISPRQRGAPHLVSNRGIFHKLGRAINQHFYALTPDGHTQLCCSVSLHGLTVGGSQLVYLQHSYPRLCEMNVFLMSCLGTRIPSWPSWCYAPLAGCWLLGKCTACTLVLFLCREVGVPVRSDPKQPLCPLFCLSMPRHCYPWGLCAKWLIQGFMESCAALVQTHRDVPGWEGGPAPSAVVLWTRRKQEQGQAAKGAAQQAWAPGPAAHRHAGLWVTADCTSPTVDHWWLFQKVSELHLSISPLLLTHCRTCF